MPKAAVLAPIPRASVATTIAVKPGVFRRRRRASRTSSSTLPLLQGMCQDAGAPLIVAPLRLGQRGQSGPWAGVVR
ncbi:MAG: hypothetical protein DMF82_20490 [Acidobacteria bacterium]|nr:MAG: hypothetical protein DMF82_20490 [Acidobacteriota bacterium]